MLRARERNWVGVIGAILLGIVMLSESACAQGRVIIQPRAAQSPFDNPPESAPSFITNREMSRRLRTAQELFAESDYRTGVKYVQSILDEKEDWFLERPFQKPAAGNPRNPEAADRQSHFSSLKHAAEKLVGNLPEAGRNAYEEEVGINAGMLLKQAVAEGDENQLNEIARRFFHTKAGYEAVYRLGLMLADHGEPFAAALQFERLQSIPRAAERFEPLLSLKLVVCWDQAGLPNQSLAVLKQLRSKSPQGRIRIGGREVKFFETDREAAGWLAQVLGGPNQNDGRQSEQWPVFRGNLNRNAASSQSSPVGPLAWSISTLENRDPFSPSKEDIAKIEKKLAKLTEAREEDKHRLPVPAAQPLIVNNAAVFRTLTHIEAIDLQSGETRWRTTHPDEMLRPVLSHADPQTEQMIGGNVLPGRNSSPQHSALESYLVQRKWRDMTTGAISSDQARVYSIEQVGLADGLYFVNSNTSDPFIPETHNKLVAFSLKDGYAEWEAGGEMLNKDDPVGGTFFLGAPLPIGGQLFCLGERKNEIRLLVLEAATGQLIWEQRLVSPVLGLMANRERRTMGLSPTFGHGVVICPTASGAIVAVDISRRMLLWAYQYESTMTEDYLVANMAWQQGRNFEFSHESLHPESRWADTTPVVANGKVLITPSDSQAIHCLNLSSGAVEWMLPRGEDVFLAGVWNERAIIVGRSQIRAVDLADGKDAWTGPLSIPLPSGRGIFAGDSYHLPLATGEIATIDLQKGKIVARSKTRDGKKLGNLVSAGGRVVFQSLDSAGAMYAWYQLQTDIDRKLKTDPEDAEALALRARMRLHQGDADAALGDLEKSYAREPAEDVRTLLVDLLLDQLRTQNGQRQEERELLRRLIRTSEESLQFLMLSASQAKTPDARAAAFRDYLKLAGTLSGETELQKIEPGHKAQSDRWIKARIQELAAAASPAELKAWDRIVQEELAGQWKEMPIESRLRILSALPRLPAVESAKLAIAQDWPGASSLEKTRLLKSLLDSADEKLGAKATLALAEAYIELWRGEEAYPLIERLGQNWPADWREKFKDLKAPETIIWPDEKFKAAFRMRQVAVLPEIPVEVERISDSPYEDWSFSIDQQSRRLLARNENGVEGWHLDLGETKGPILDFDGITITIDGHLGVLSFGTHFAVLDLLKRQHTASVLWSGMLMGSEGNMEEWVQLQQIQRNRIFGGNLQAAFDSGGEVKLLGSEVVVYQVGERLTAADPLSGRTLWTRDNLQPNSRLFGDGSHLVVVAPDGGSAHVYRTTDGGSVRIVKLPGVEDLVLFEGVDLVHWNKADGKRTLVCRSLIDDETRWSIDFSARPELQKVGREHLAVLEDGRFRVVSLADGSAVVDAKIEADPLRKSFHVSRLGSRFLLLTDRSGQPAIAGGNPFAGDSDGILVDGPVYAFDGDTGKLLWETSIENQSLEKLPPRNSPVLMLNKRRPAGRAIGGFGQNDFQVRVLDLRTGETVYKHNRLQNVSPWSVRVHPTRQTVAITFYKGVIELEITKPPMESS